MNGGLPLAFFFPIPMYFEIWWTQPSLANSVCWGYMPRYPVINIYFCSEYSKIGRKLGENWSKVKIERFNAEKVKKTQYFSLFGDFGKDVFQSPEKPKIGDIYEFFRFWRNSSKKIGWTNSRLGFKIWSSWQLKWNKNIRDGEICDHYAYSSHATP